MKTDRTTKTIVVMNQKGGVGKTFISDELCFMCETLNLPYDFYDMDGQGGCIHSPQRVKDPAIQIIDTPGALTANMNKWIETADLVIIPTLMTRACIPSLETMIEIMRPWQEKGKQQLIILNQWDRFTACANFEEWFFQKYPHANTVTLSESEVVKQAAANSQSVTKYNKYSKSAVEMQAFWKIVLNLLIGEGWDK